MRLIVYSVIFRGLYTAGGAGFLPSTVVFQFQHDIHHWLMMFLNIHITKYTYRLRCAHCPVTVENEGE